MSDHVWFPLHQPVGDDGDSGQWEQPDEGSNPERRDVTVGAGKEVVVEAIFLVPDALAVDGVGDVHEVLEELHGHVRAGRVVLRQFHRNKEHGLAVAGHPGGAVCLLQRPRDRQLLRAIEGPDVVEA